MTKARATLWLALGAVGCTGPPVALENASPAPVLFLEIPSSGEALRVEPGEVERVPLFAAGEGGDAPVERSVRVFDEGLETLLAEIDCTWTPAMDTRGLAMIWDGEVGRCAGPWRPSTTASRGRSELRRLR